MAVDSEPPSGPRLDKERHMKYWQRCHGAYLPSPYTSADSTRLLFACFTISAMDLLGMPLTRPQRAAIRTWVLSLQHPDGGFCGSSTHAMPRSIPGGNSSGTANLAGAFFALILLAAAAEGEEEAAGAFAGVDRRKLLRWLRRLQREDGSFGQNLWDGQPEGGRDTRHSYMAVSVRWMVRGASQEGDEAWEEDIDVERTVANIRQCQIYDGGVADAPQHESNSGYVYCSVAALAMLDRPLDWSNAPSQQSSPHSALQSGIPDRDALISFLCHRPFEYMAKEEEETEDEDNLIEVRLGELDLADDGRCRHSGFNGRLNKKADICYAWWVGGALALLDETSLIDAPPTRRFFLDLAQHRIGGFPKMVGAPPDLFHSYLGLAYLATIGDPDLKELDVGLCCSSETTRKIERAREGLLQLANGDNRRKWEQDGFWD